MPVKFGENRPKNKKVSGTVYFPGQGRQAAGRPAVKAPLGRGKLARSAPSPGCPASENFKIVRSRPNSVGVLGSVRNADSRDFVALRRL